MTEHQYRQKLYSLCDQMISDKEYLCNDTSIRIATAITKEMIIAWARDGFMLSGYKQSMKKLVLKKRMLIANHIYKTYIRDI